MERTLIGAEGAPLKQALPDAGLGEDVSGGFRGELLQPYFYVASRNIMAFRQLQAWCAELTEKLARLRDEGFDALFVFCDVEAWHAMDAMQKSGRFRPDDFGIASFDNLEGALSFPIPLCSVSCDYEEMAHAGIDLLRARIHGDDRPPRTIVRPVRLVCRGSCGKNKE